MIGYMTVDFNRNLTKFCGRGAKIKPVPDGHFIYECCFDISKDTGRLTGIWIEDELVGVFFSFEKRSIVKTRHSEKVLKIGTNIIVYSLLREGSLAKKVF